MNKESVLHIYIDESGNFDFGAEGGSRYYVVSFVLTEKLNFETEKNKLFFHLHKIDKDIDLIHCVPLIRQKSGYMNFKLEKRVKILDAFFKFIKEININGFVCISNKIDCNSIVKLHYDLVDKISKSLAINASRFSKYNNIVVHYDNGQAELTEILKLSFNRLFKNVKFEFTNIMKNEILIQVSDAIASICSINEKYKYNKTNSKEREFFKSKNNFKINYYKVIEKILNK